MPDSSQVAQTKIVLAELFALWDSRSDSYGEVLYGSAVSHEYDKWKNVTTYMFPLHKTERRDADVYADYQDFKIAGGLIPLEEAKSTIVRMVETGQLSLPKLPQVELVAYLYSHCRGRFYGSDDRRFPIQYPFTEFSFGVDTNFKAHAPHRILWAKDYPVFPSAGTAIENLLYAHFGNINAYDGQFSVLVPDYRARIRELRLSTTSAQVRVDCPMGSDENDLVAKVYVEGTDQSSSQDVFEFKKGQASFSTSGFPHHLVLVLISKSKKDLIDQRVFYAGTINPATGIIIDAPEQDLEHLVLAGESDTTEFKRELPQKREDLAVAAVSFANQNGGRILVGVDDSAQVVGCETEKADETITNVLRSYCDPLPEFTAKEAALRQKRIVVITIAPGKDKPYCVRDRGVYVRSGSTNRLATRYELDQMYAEKDRMKSPLGL